MRTRTNLSNRLLSMLLCVALLVTSIPWSARAAEPAVTTVADPETLTRPETIYGDSTVNAGKVTVGKSVSDEDVTVNGQTITIDGDNNFLVTISQSAQVMGLASESSVPVDVVFVLDTSGSMEDNNRATTMVSAANSAIATLMSANSQNRVAVVAFSSEGYGGGTSNGAAANVLSSLAHYTGDAATSHLQWVNSQGSTTGNGRTYIAGRDTGTIRVNNQNRTVNAFRNSVNGGTNIQSGIVAGAKLLTSVTNTTYTDPETNEAVTRMPFLIILSDGQPTFSYDDETWYDPTITGTNAADEQGPGSGAYEGNGFLAAMTAAYYKGLITQHYYGDKASNDNHCHIYTMGVEIDSLTGDNLALARITLDPKTYTTGAHAAANANSYWNYGNTANDNTKNTGYGWKSYWNAYLANPAADFGVRVDGGNQSRWVWTGTGTPQAYYEMEEPEEPNRWASQSQWDAYYAELEAYEQWEQWRDNNFTRITGSHYTFTAESVAASRKYVNGVGYTGGIGYNDSYFNASNVSQMETIFQELVTTIQQKAISVPTKVTTGDHDFDGYVTFTDPLGEYMEVKDMKGILADGYFYQGASFAQKLARYGTANADAEFDALILDVIQSRMQLTSSVVDISDFVAKMKASENQAYYNGPNDYDNSIVWWGSSYDTGEEDKQVQVVGFADNDTIEYIEAQKEAGTIPAGADYVCRSYFFYGEAGGANPNPDHEYLYFMVRVQRELTAPYRETVVISAPASLLSMEKVLITESTDDSGQTVYTAAVEHQEPARVVYEVGLWDTITPENVSWLVSKEYASETVNGSGSVNYDPATDTYYFFTNDWDRTQTLDSHHRAIAKATFDAAADNPFYTYQKDTLVVDTNGNAVTSDPAGTTAYYVREYYEWTDGKQDGTYDATKKTTLVEVEIPADAELIQKDGKWYIPAGVYTAATLVVNGDDTLKDDPATSAANDGNLTGTSSIVAHPHRTGDSNNSHYTVYLGNNGKLSMKADTYVPGKTVSVNLPDTAVTIVDDNGKAVKIGDVLTYTVEVTNVLNETADITVADYVPQGTAFVPGSAGSGTAETGHTKDAAIVPDSNRTLTWVLKDVPAGQTRYVSFQAVVTEAVLSLTAVPGDIQNTATVQIGGISGIVSHTTSNPTYGKTVTDQNNQSINGVHGLKVGDTLVYHIRFQNTAENASGDPVAANVTVTDKVPDGTAFLSADNGGSYDAATGVVTWNFENVAPNAAKVVSFRVQITADAKIAQSGTQPESGEIHLPNTAQITIGNDPVVITNPTDNYADVGDMVITKTVAQGGDQNKSFTVRLTESTGKLSGTYVLKRDEADETVTFTNGEASVTIRHGQTLTVKGLPAGAIITVEEDTSALPGWTPAYNTNSVTIVKGTAAAAPAVSVTNTYTLQPLTVTLKGIKTLNGTMLTEGTFGFVAEPDSANPVPGGPLTGEVTVKASGNYNFTFSPKVFTQPGEYKYTIYEINGGLHGVTYDTTRHTLVITVTDNGDGTMSAVAALGGSSFDLNADAVNFTNTFVPDDVPLTVKAQKTLMTYNAATDSYQETSVSAGQFRFQIKEKTRGTVVATGSNAADGSVTFNTFYFSAAMLDGIAPVQGAKSKTFTFVVSEVIPQLAKDPNMLYDQRELEFEAVLTLAADGALSVSVNGDSDGTVDLTNSVSFVNYQNPDSVEVKPVGTKTTLNAPAGVTFSFAVINTQNGNVPAAGVGNANGAINFSALSFSEVGTYTYWIKESNAGNTTNGITYDPARYLMKVVVSRNTYNRLVAEVTYWSSAVVGSENVADYTVSVAAPSFRNEYNAGGYINLTATKKLTGRDLRAGEFAFKLIRQDNGGKIEGIVDETGKITFSTMYYSENDIPAGSSSAVIHYVMSEVIPETAKLPGVTYDDTEHDVYVRIMDNGSGVISTELVKPDGNGGYTAIGSNDTGVVFNNTYAPVHGDEIKFQIEKSLNGRDLRDGEFDFQLWLGGSVVDIATNDENGIVTFTREIPAAAAQGIHTFTIKEAAGTLAGVTYSGASFDVRVKVSDDGHGNIVAQLVDANGDPLPEDANGVVDLTNEIEFVNTYVPGDVEIKLEAEKFLSGRPLRDQEFSFVVRKDTATGTIVATGSNDAAGKIRFSTFDITAADMAGATNKTFTYVITESDNNVPGVKVDDTDHIITVIVTDNGNGALTAAVNYPSNAATFNNTYTPEQTQLPLVVFKHLDGKNLQDEEFTFELREKSTGNLLQSKKNNANGVARFDDLVFKAEDMVDGAGQKVMEKTFVYTVTEKAGSMNGMEYDDNVYTVTVTVTDDGNGHLTASAAYTDEKNVGTPIRFTNDYTPPQLKVELEGAKSIVDTDGNPLIGTKYPLSGFEFEVRGTDNTLLFTEESDGEGKISFDEFAFTEAGEYRYLISEKTTNKPGYTTDTTVWCAHITVGYNADTGVLYKAEEYIHPALESHEGVSAQADSSLSFVNTYDPADVSLILKAKKNLTGRELRDHEFTFYMTDDATGLLVAQTRNHANGDVRFSLSYAKAGTYNYTVSEYEPADNDKVGGVQYTKDTFKVTVNVTDDGSGALKAEVGSFTVLGEDVVDLSGTVVFENTYKADPVEVTVNAMKLLDGKALGKDDFTFELVNTEDPTEKYTASNTEDGTVKFDAITFTEADEYVYTLSEKKGTAKGVTYDTHTYTVTIQVTDDGNGRLQAVTHYTSSDGGTEAVPVFHNLYEAAPVSYAPQAVKRYEGGKMGTFTFLLSGEGFESQTKQNDAEGKILFDELTFEKAGQYTFTVQEQPDDSIQDIKWDTNVYTMTVSVTDDGSGELKIAGVTVTSETGRNDLVFRNVHEDLIAKKEVFVNGEKKVNIDGKTVKVGDVLTYTITYKNYTGKTVGVTITDTIPKHTAYVEGSAKDAQLKDGVLTWQIGNIAPDAEVTVSFDVKVSDAGTTVENTAVVLEGTNTYETNTVKVTVSVPPADPENPDTGDYSNMNLWMMLMLLSGVGFISLLYGVRRKETE